jgi:hypothetical protein
MEGSDFSRPCITGFGSSPSRCGPDLLILAGDEISRFPRKERTHMLGSTTAPSRPGARDDAPVHVAFRSMHSVGVPGVVFSRLNTQPMRTPVNASPSPSRGPTHDSGTVWFARPSLGETCTPYSLPVSRRTHCHVSDSCTMIGCIVRRQVRSLRSLDLAISRRERRPAADQDAGLVTAMVASRACPRCAPVRGAGNGSE